MAPLVTVVTPTEYFLGLIFTPALAPPNGTSGTEIKGHRLPRWMTSKSPDEQMLNAANYC